MIRSNSSGVIRISALALLMFACLFPPITFEHTIRRGHRAVLDSNPVWRDFGAGVPSIHAPLENAILTSGFGVRLDPFTHTERFHSGIDLATSAGTRIRSIGFGVVAYIGHNSGYGNVIVIDHGNGLTSHYGHCSELGVSVGNRVEPGTVIGKVGRSGRATGPHLHLEIRLGGRPLWLGRGELFTNITL